ncbi:MAG: hypothetical protein JWP75_3879, partial [Frondihabitans sp.]|nr:hypothetical protein [Frondihabitans sp.]
QGQPVDLGAADELHLLKPVLWTDLVNGTGSRYDCMVAGITTAGDDSSELLIRLYAEDSPGRGKFIWEAEEARIPDDDETLGRYIMQANPSVAHGRTPLDRVIESVRGMPPGEAIRYRLNRFIDGSDNGYLTAAQWLKCKGDVSIRKPVLTVDRAPDWSFATIVATMKASDGVIETEVVASIVKPTMESLLAECMRLSKHSPQTFVVDAFSLKALGDQLKQKGQPVRYMNFGDEISAASMVYAKVVGGEIRHAGDELLTRQFPNVVRKTHNDAYKLARVGAEPIDAVMATVRGIYVAETTEDTGMQLF